MRFFYFIVSVLMLAAIFFPIGYALHIEKGWVGFIYGLGIGLFGGIISNIWYNSLNKEEK